MIPKCLQERCNLRMHNQASENGTQSPGAELLEGKQRDPAVTDGILMPSHVGPN